VAIDDLGSPPANEEVRLNYYGVTLRRYGVRAEVTAPAAPPFTGSPIPPLARPTSSLTRATA